MALTSEQEEKLERYSAGSLSPEEERLFLAESESNEELRDAIELELVLRDNFELIDMPSVATEGEKSSPFDDPIYLKSLVDRVAKEWHDDNEHTHRSEKTIAPVVPIRPRGANVISINFWSAIAVAVTLIIAISLIITETSESNGSQIANKPDSIPRKSNDTGKINSQPQEPVSLPKPKPEYARLNKENYRKDKIPPVLPQPIESELQSYADNSYEDLEKIDLEDIGVTRGDNDPLNSPQNVRELGHYYKGIAFIETKNDKQAETNFQWVIKRAKNKSLVGKATWYLALLKIKQEKGEEAIKLLQEVLANKSVPEYHERTQKLLDQLK